VAALSVAGLDLIRRTYVPEVAFGNLDAALADDGYSRSMP
jgi:hypothetical protein